MKVDIVMPKMGESLTEGTILKWTKNIGDKVERDETILEISTDKVDTEVPAPVAGILTEILAQENETVEIGKVIARIETEADGQKEQLPKKAETPQPVKEDVRQPAPNESEIETPVPIPKEEKTNVNQESKVESRKAEDTVSKLLEERIVDIVMPKMGESLTEGTILKWLKNVGDRVERDETILEISTDKVDTEVPAPVAGTLVEILAQENEKVEVGKPIARISTGEAPSKTKVEAAPSKAEELIKAEEKPREPERKVESMSASEPTVTATKEIPRKSGDKFYSPLVRNIAMENNVTLEEIETIKGSGIDGRVNKKDLLDYIESRKQPEIKPKSIAEPKKEEVKISEAHPAPRITETQTWGPDVEIIPMDRVRQLIAEHMVYSKHTSAHVSSVIEADVLGIVKYREKYKDAFFKREGIKLTLTSFLTKAIIEGIKAHPMVNVSVDGKNIIKHNRINLGIATSLPDGNLIVPVIKNADALSITGLQRAITDLAGRARIKKLNPDDIMGGTITITNYGTAGTLFGSPIINQPQTAIFGLGAIKKRPIVMEVDGEYIIAIRDMMYLTISYDHRVIDGQLAGDTLASIVRVIENMNENTITL